MVTTSQKNNIRDLPLSGKLQSDNSIRASDSWRRCRKRNYAMPIKRLFDAVERRGDIGRRVDALVLPISYRPRVTSSCPGKIGLRQPGEHTSGPNLASRDNVAHKQTLYTILETPPPVHLALFESRPGTQRTFHRDRGRVRPPKRGHLATFRGNAALRSLSERSGH